MAKRNEEGYSTNFALKMIRTALRDAKIAGLLVSHRLTPTYGDNPQKERYLRFSGEVHAETMTYDVHGECWIQRGEGSTNQNPWKYGQIEFTVDTGMTNGKVPRMFYRYDEKSGMERLRRSEITIVNYITTGKFAAWFTNQPETMVSGTNSKEEAVGKLLLRFSERFPFVFEESQAR